MENSSYYKNQMYKWKDLKDKAIKEKNKYENILMKLKKLISELPFVKSDLIASETAFKNGGYNDNGITFDRGILKKEYDILEKDIEKLNTIISSIQSKINKLTIDIENYQNKYYQSNRNYNQALNAERQ